MFSEQLCAEADPDKRDVLMRLLIEEENRFGFHAWHFDVAQRHIHDANVRVEQQKALIGRMQADGQDVTLANGLLENMLTTLELFHKFYRSVANSMDDCDI